MPRACSARAVIRAVIDKASELGKPVIVDPKGIDFSIYRGATLITPNRKELADAHASARSGDMESPKRPTSSRTMVGCEACW